jgi:RHS repeat-associated protein
MIDQVQGSGISTEQQKKTWLINWYFANDPMGSIYLATLRNPALVASHQTSPGMLYGSPFAIGMENYFIKIRSHFGQSMFDQLVTEFAQQSNLYVDEIKVDEWHLYGSSRLGVYEANRLISKRVARDLNLDNQITSNEYVIETPEEVTYLFSSYQLERGAKRYELSNHLGNVLTVISDKKTAIFTGTTFNYFAAERISATDYSPFGAPLASRTWQASEYRFGFNGQEKEAEVAELGNIISADYWLYESRLGRRWNVDPKPNPCFSSYSCFANNPISFSDPYGDTLFLAGGNTSEIQQSICDLKLTLDVNNRARIGWGQLTGRNDANYSNYLTVNTSGYVPGTDAAMDLFIALSGVGIDAVYTTQQFPEGEYTSGDPRTSAQNTKKVNDSYSNFGDLVQSLAPKQGLGNNQSSIANHNFPPSKILTDPVGNSIPTTVSFLVGIQPGINKFRSDKSNAKSIPRAMVAFQRLNATYLLNLNSGIVGYNLTQAVNATNNILRSPYYKGVKGEPNHVPYNPPQL